MIVGSAEVVIRAIGDKLEGDIQRALNNAAAKARPAGRKAGQEYAKGMGDGIEAESASFEGKISKSISGAMDRGSKEGAKSVGKNLGEAVNKDGGGARVGEQLGKNIGNNVAKGMGRSNMRRGLVASILKLGLLVPVVSVLIGGISSLASGLFAVGAAAGSASQAMVSGLGAVTALVQGGAVAMIAFKGVGDAIKKGLDPTQAAEFAKALKTLPKPAQEFVKEFVKLKPVFSDIKKEAQRGLFPELTKALPGVTKILGVFKNNMRDSGKAVGTAIRSITDALSSGFALGNLHDVMQSNNKVIKSFGVGIGGLAKGFIALLAAARPLTEGLGKAFASWGKNIGQMLESKNRTGELTATLSEANKIFQIIWRSVKNFGAALFDVGKIAKPVGVDLLKSFEGATKRFREFANAPENEKKISKFFEDVGSNTKKISSLFGELGKAFLRMGANPGIGKTADAIKAIIPNIERALNAGVDLGPKIAQLVGQIADLFAVLQESGALGRVLDIFIAVGKALTALAKIPGVGIALQIMAIVFALRMLAKAGSFIGVGIGKNFAAMDAAVGRTRRGLTSLRTPMTMVQTRTDALRRSFLNSQTSMIPFIRNSQYVQRHTLGMGQQMTKTGVQFKNFGNTMPIVARNMDGVGKNATAATGRFGKIGSVLGKVGTSFKGVGIGGALASGALLTAGAAAGSSGSKINKFSATLTGAGIGMMAGPWGAAVGGAVGGLIDLGRHFSSSGDKAKKAAEGIKVYQNNLKQMSTAVRGSSGFGDNFAFLDQIQKRLDYWKNKRHSQILIGADTTEADGKIKALTSQYAREKAWIESHPPTLDAKLNFAETQIQATQLVNDIKNRMKELGGRKFKFAPFDTGPFQQESIALARAIQALTAGAMDSKNFAGLRSSLVGMKGLFGINRQEAKLLANSLANLKDPLQGIEKPRKIKFTSEMEQLFRDLGVGEEAIARIKNQGEKPIKIAATFDVRDGGAQGKIYQLIDSMKGLKPTQMITLQTDTGPVTRSVADVTAAIQAYRNQPADFTLGVDGKPAIADANAAMKGILAQLAKTDPTVEVGAEKKPGTDAVFNQIAAAALGVDQEVFAKLGAQKIPGFDGIIAGVLSATGKVKATDVRALVGAKQGDMGAVGKVLQQAGIISKTQAKALVGAKQGDMSAIAKVLREAGLITKKEYKALVGSKKGNTSSIEDLKGQIRDFTGKPHEAKVGVKKVTGGGFLGGITDILKSFAPAKTSTVNVGVKANTAAAKGDISKLGQQQAVKIPVAANVTKARGDINGLRRKNPITIATKLGQEAARALNKINRKSAVTIKTKADTGAARTIAKIDRKSLVQVRTKADTKAQSAISKISRKGTVTIKTAATGDAQSKINKITGKTVSVYVKLTGPGASKLAGGGMVTGPGSGFSDMVPAWLSAGEFVVRASQVRKNLALLKAINAGSGIPERLQPAPMPVFDFSNDGSAATIAGAGGPGNMTVTGVLSLVDGKAYITGIATEKSENDTAYRNSLDRVGQNN